MERDNLPVHDKFSFYHFISIYNGLRLCSYKQEITDYRIFGSHVIQKDCKLPVLLVHDVLYYEHQTDKRRCSYVYWL